MSELFLSGLRATVVPILAARNALPTDVAERLLDDSSAAVRFDALRSLIKEGREFPDDKIKSILVKPAARGGLGGLFGTYPAVPADKEGEQLWERFTKLKLRAENETALEKMLADATILDVDVRFALDFRRFKTRAGTLRAAIDDRFQAEFSAGLRKLEQLLTNMDTLNRIRSIEEGMRKEMVRKGTDILCEKNESADLDRIRRVASSGFVPFSPLDAEYFKRHGEWQDISLLIEVLGRSDGSLSLLGGLFDDDKVRLIAEAIHSIGKTRFPLARRTGPHLVGKGSRPAATASGWTRWNLIPTRCAHAPRYPSTFPTRWSRRPCRRRPQPPSGRTVPPRRCWRPWRTFPRTEARLPPWLCRRSQPPPSPAATASGA